MAMTADGKIATTNRAVSSFGSRRDHDHLLELRATADAVMCGARTADLNRITLGPGGKKFQQQRLRAGLAEFNLRIIVTGSGSVDPDAHIFKSRNNASGVSPAQPGPIIMLTTHRAGADRLKTLRALADEVILCGRREINFRRALGLLRNKWRVRRLLCEGGGELNDALFRAGLVNELHLTVCARIFGGRLAPTIADGTGFPSLAFAVRWKLKSSRRVGDEMFLVFERDDGAHG
jgi:riboflavin-specific deaminase-like protein